ncbi:unnamed protein product, partial [Prorocentrum cordatum]
GKLLAPCQGGRLRKALALLGAAALLSTVGCAVARAQRPDVPGRGSAADVVGEDIELGSGAVPQGLER